MNKRNNTLVVSGCMISFTPVVKNYINLLNEYKYNFEIIEYKNFQRAAFILQSLKMFFSNDYSNIVCINQQSLPIVFLLSWLTKKEIVYWKLETYKITQNFSIVTLLSLFEFISNRNNISLIVPTAYRQQIQKPNFHKTYVLPNAPIKPLTSYKYNSTRTLRKSELSLVLYGTISNVEDVYLNQWISLCEQNKYYNLHVIGKENLNGKNITYSGKIHHDELIKKLIDPQNYHFSIVGYKPNTPNKKFAAPNKLIESLACGLPIIGHSENPYVLEIISKYNCGIVINFENLTDISPDFLERSYHNMVIGAIEAANDLCLSQEITHTPLL